MSGNQGRFKQISMGELKKMEIKCPQALTMHLDGETFAGFASDVHHLKIELIPNAIEVVLPA